MKKWNNPVVEELSLNQTAAGGSTITDHDGNIYSYTTEDGKVVAVEEYYPVSGKDNNQ